jgi:hypothetical protein
MSVRLESGLVRRDAAEIMIERFSQGRTSALSKRRRAGVICVIVALNVDLRFDGSCMAFPF